MTEIEVIDRDGGSHTLAVTAGATLMEVLRDGDVQADFALCGGACSCATCHVYVEAIDAPDGISLEEGELLDGSSHRRPGSRLSCQVSADERLAGARIVIAPLD